LGRATFPKASKTDLTSISALLGSTPGIADPRFSFREGLPPESNMECTLGGGRLGQATFPKAPKTELTNISALLGSAPGIADP